MTIDGPHRPSIACIGELIWDELPSGRALGGAPANVAFHLARQGCSQVALVSRVGADAAGQEARSLLAARGLSTRWLQTDSELPTGVARVEVGPKGEPRFRIGTPAAWDRIETVEVAADVVIFGSLAQRDPVSRHAIRSLLAAASQRVFDVNLRAPYDDRAIVLESLELATLVKLNEGEVVRLSEWLGLPRDAASFAEALRARHSLDGVCVTLGERGALLAQPDGLEQAQAPRVEVVDTVGAGDAFLAGLLAARFDRRPARVALERACALAAFVASRPGAMPD